MEVLEKTAIQVEDAQLTELRGKSTLRVLEQMGESGEMGLRLVEIIDAETQQPIEEGLIWDCTM